MKKSITLIYIAALIIFVGAVFTANKLIHAVNDKLVNQSK